MAPYLQSMSRFKQKEANPPFVFSSHLVRLEMRKKKRLGNPVSDLEKFLENNRLSKKTARKNNKLRIGSPSLNGEYLHLLGKDLLFKTSKSELSCEFVIGVHGFIDKIMPVSKYIERNTSSNAHTNSKPSELFGIPKNEKSSAEHISSYLKDDISKLTKDLDKNVPRIPKPPSELLETCQSSAYEDKKRENKSLIEKLKIRREESYYKASKLAASQKPLVHVSSELPSNCHELLKKARSGSLRFDLTPQDLSTLLPGQWLNDEVINYALDLVLKRSKQPENKDFPQIHVFNTFFYSNLKQSYDKVKRWTRKIDIFSLDLVLIPVHLANHWCMAGIDFRSKRILYFDSLLGEGESKTKLFLDYLKAESMDKKKMPLDESEWKECILDDIPLQMNGYDCGMFAIMFGRCLASPNFPVNDTPKHFHFSQKDMKTLRLQIAYEIVTGKLLEE